MINYLQVIILYFIYIVLNHIINQFTILMRMFTIFKDIMLFTTVINLYEMYIELHYADLTNMKNICLELQLNNRRKFNVIINKLYKINFDIVIFTNRKNFIPMFSDIKRIIIQPNKFDKIYLRMILKNKLPYELIMYTSSYLCNCRLCENII